MLKGVNLSLMIGPVNPVPVGKDVLEALTSVSVITSTEGPSVFTLNFELMGLGGVGFSSGEQGIFDYGRPFYLQ